MFVSVEGNRVLWSVGHVWLKGMGTGNSTKRWERVEICAKIAKES